MGRFDNSVLDNVFCMCFISTEGALRLATTYDNNAIQSHPVQPYQISLLCSFSFVLEHK